MSLLTHHEDRLVRELWQLRDRVNKRTSKPGTDGWHHDERQRAEAIKRWLKQDELDIQAAVRRPRVAGGGWNLHHRAARFQIVYATRLRHHQGRPEVWDRPQETLGERAFHVAESLLWVVETGHNSGPGVSKIILENGGLIGEAWCGDAVAYYYRHAGSKSVNRSWASARLTGGSWHVSSPRRGDPVYYVFDHVEIFDHDRGDGTIATIGANTSCPSGQGICRKVRSKSLVSHYTRVRS